MELFALLDFNLGYDLSRVLSFEKHYLGFLQNW
jgi:hypothetical protein